MFGRVTAIGVGAELHTVGVFVKHTRRERTAADMDSGQAIACARTSYVVRPADPDALTVLHEKADSQSSEVTTDFILDANVEWLVLSQI